MQFNYQSNLPEPTSKGVMHKLLGWVGRNKAIVVVVLFASIGLTVYSIQNVFSAPIYVYQEQGEVYTKASQEDIYSPVQSLRVEVEEGTFIKTENGFAHVVLRDGSIVSLEPYTEMQVEESSSLFTRLYQISGNTWHRVKKLVSTDDDRYQVESGSVAASVRGTEFGIIVQSPSKSVVYLDQGGIQLGFQLPLDGNSKVIEPSQISFVNCENECLRINPITLKDELHHKQFLTSRFVQRNKAISSIFGENYTIPSDFQSLVQSFPVLLEQYSSSMNLSDILDELEQKEQQSNNPLNTNEKIYSNNSLESGAVELATPLGGINWSAPILKGLIPHIFVKEHNNVLVSSVQSQQDSIISSDSHSTPNTDILPSTPNTPVPNDDVIGSNGQDEDYEDLDDVETIIEEILNEECQNGERFVQIICFGDIDDSYNNENPFPTDITNESYTESGAELYLNRSSQNHFHRTILTCNHVDVYRGETTIIPYAMIQKCTHTDIGNAEDAYEHSDEDNILSVSEPMYEF